MLTKTLAKPNNVKNYIQFNKKNRVHNIRQIFCTFIIIMCEFISIIKYNCKISKICNMLYINWNHLTNYIFQYKDDLN